jgi:hypothetical protein
VGVGSERQVIALVCGGYIGDVLIELWFLFVLYGTLGHSDKNSREHFFPHFPVFLNTLSYTSCTSTAIHWVSILIMIEDRTAHGCILDQRDDIVLLILARCKHKHKT